MALVFVFLGGVKADTNTLWLVLAPSPSAVRLSSLRMITTPPKQAMFRLWASRNALTSDLTATFTLSDTVGMNDVCLGAYLQGIVDHVFQVKSSQVSIEGNVLRVSERWFCRVHSRPVG